MKKYWLYIALLLLGFGLLMYTQSNVPKEEDWRPSYSRFDKIPYGSKALYELIKATRGDRNISTIDTPLYPYLDTFRQDRHGSSNIIIISQSSGPDKAEAKKILDFVAKGNNVFLASEYVYGNLADSLKLKPGEQALVLNEKDSSYLHFTNTKLAKDSFHYKTLLAARYFNLPDTSAITILGRNSHGDPNFIRYQFGQGNFYFSSVPHAFTNYALLEENNWKYAFTALSYLPDNYTLWDEYDKPFPGGVKGYDWTLKHYSELSVILEREPLRWAYYILMIGLILYIIFEGKRKQRIIPVVQPPRNTTVDFVETVGRLYYQHANHKKLAEKKITHFYDFLRQRLHLRFSQPDEKLYRQLSIKAGMPEEEVVQLFKAINRINILPDTTSDDLLELNEKIDNFYKRYSG